MGAAVQPTQLGPLACIYNYKRAHGSQESLYERIDTSSINPKAELYIKKVHISSNPESLTLKFQGHSDHSSNYPLTHEETNTIYLDPPTNAQCSSSDELFKYYKLQIEAILKVYSPKNITLNGHSLGAYFALRSADHIKNHMSLNSCQIHVNTINGFSKLTDMKKDGICYYINFIALSCLGSLPCFLIASWPGLILNGLLVVTMLVKDQFPFPLALVIDAWEMNNEDLVEKLQNKVDIHIHQIENDEIIPKIAQLYSAIAEKKIRPMDLTNVALHPYEYSGKRKDILCRHTHFPAELMHPPLGSKSILDFFAANRG